VNIMFVIPASACLLACIAPVVAPARLVAQTIPDRTRAPHSAVTVFTGDFITLDSITPRAKAVAVRDATHD
jgi:hypothetical protein